MNSKSAVKRKRTSTPTKQKQEKQNPSILSYFKSHSKQQQSEEVTHKKNASSDDDLQIVLVEKKSKFFGSRRSNHSDSWDDGGQLTTDSPSVEVRKPNLRRLSLRKRSNQSIECSESSVKNDDESLGCESKGVVKSDHDVKIKTRSQSLKHKIPNVQSNKPMTKSKLCLRKEKVTKNVTTNITKNSLQQTKNALSLNETKFKETLNTEDICEEKHLLNVEDHFIESSVPSNEKIKKSFDDGQSKCKNIVEYSKLNGISATSIVEEPFKTTLNQKQLNKDSSDQNELDITENSSTDESSPSITRPSQSKKRCLTSESVETSSQGNVKEQREDTSSAVVHNTNGSSKPGGEDELSQDGKMETGETKFRTPYYLENFQTILSAVLENEDNGHLFDKTDLESVSLFNNLSDLSKKLYVRLFSRKLSWIPLSKLKYPEIADDLTDVLEEIIDAGLAMSESDLTDLVMTLKSLSLPDLKTLSKSYHLNITGSSKTQIVDLLWKKSKQSTISVMFGVKSKSHDPSTIMLSRAKKLLGRMFRLQEVQRKVFARILMLFSVLHSSIDDERSNGGQIYQMLLVNIGKVIYPQFKVNKQTQLFLDRDSFLRFETAMHFENDLSLCVERGNWAGAFDVYEAAKQEYDHLQTHSELVSWDSSLPSFLRLCSAGCVLVRVLSQGIEILQRRKDYSGAISLLHELLDQNIYCSDHRGYWWERLALNLDAHLKKPTQALDAVREGLADEHVTVGHRLALYQRAEKICNTASLNLQHCLKDFYHTDVIETPKVTIEGRTMPHSVPGIKNQFITADSQRDEFTCCGVEELVLNHYRTNGYTDGLHAEGSVVTNLFCFFFWDILFMDVPDAFHSTFQTHPLDFHSDSFYTRRKQAVETKLSQIVHSTEEDLHNMLSEVWTNHYGVLCAGLNWERFSSLDHALGLVSCIGGKTLAGIMRRFVTNPRHTRSGFPDLTLWNTDKKIFKICEVKGPGDRLSHKQILWLDFLVKLGVDAEVCHVKAVGAKKLKPVSSMS